MDPRLHSISRNISRVRRAYAVLSIKGGVGKTTVSTLLALYASRKLSVGLLDADIVNPSTHVLLGLKPEEIRYREEKGIEPYNVDSMRYVSIAAFTGEKPLPLRGGETGDVLRELLAIVKWGDLDILFIDTPPGISDEHLDLLYSLRSYIKPIIVATPSKLALRSVSRLITLLDEAGYNWIGLVENMGYGGLRGNPMLKKASYLGYIPFIPGIEECIASRRVGECMDQRILDGIIQALLTAS
ncbi:MAG: P-loop NTPase [Desulfurococcus sp.]|nr:P-loop NTPase [Desulfurococcus sp.]